MSEQQEPYFTQPTAVEVSPTDLHLETIEARLTEKNALLAEIRDQLFSLRVDLGPMADYFKSIMQAAEAQDAEANRLPIGFPAAAKLEEVGITAVAEVPRKSSTLRQMGLDDAEITAVLTELSQGKVTL